MDDPYKLDDRLRRGTVLSEGWGGTVAHDHNHVGLYRDGPQPARNPLQRLIGLTTSDEPPLPPNLSIILTRAERVRMTVTRTTVRQSLKLPVPRPVGKLKPLILGRKRYGVARSA